jgi:pyruvate formate lyase activating enzyme
VDIKAFTEEFYKEVTSAKLAPVLESSKVARKLGMHIEVINLIIPTKNDSPDETRELSKWVYENLGADTPIHFTRFHPQYKTTDLPPTPVETLERAHEIATEEGLRYVYIGNVYGHRYEHTYCPNCGKMIIKRDGFSVSEHNITPQKTCSYCGENIPIVGDSMVEDSRWD